MSDGQSFFKSLMRMLRICLSVKRAVSAVLLFVLFLFLSGILFTKTNFNTDKAIRTPSIAVSDNSKNSLSAVLKDRDKIKEIPEHNIPHGKNNEHLILQENTQRRLSTHDKGFNGGNNQITFDDGLLPPRRNADTITFLQAMWSQIEDGVQVVGWREKVKKILGETVEKLLPRVPVNLSKLTWRQYDLMAIPQFEFLPNFKNPCWRESFRPRMTCGMGERDRDKRFPTDFLRCLPYFYLIGQPKCGTTDIYKRLARHPDTVLPYEKEPYWIEQNRFNGVGCASINTYLDYQRNSAVKIQRDYNTCTTRSGQRYHNKITGDGSVGLMWDHSLWPLLPGNEGCSEPCVTNADIVHHLNPAAKIVVSFRDPVERVYSDYLYESFWMLYPTSRDLFHEEVLSEIQEFSLCLKNFSLRACVYNGSHENALATKARIRVGLYSVQMADWLKVFPRKQIHVIKFEDYKANVRAELQKLFRFLDLRELTGYELLRVLESKPANTRKKNHVTVGDMRNDTRMILTDFYRQYNRQLVDILQDNAFLWDNHS